MRYKQQVLNQYPNAFCVKVERSFCVWLDAYGDLIADAVSEANDPRAAWKLAWENEIF